jgi:hypothetical protein
LSRRDFDFLGVKKMTLDLIEIIWKLWKDERWGIYLYGVFKKRAAILIPPLLDYPSAMAMGARAAESLD